MVYWIKKFAKIAGFIAFFTVFFVSSDFSEPPELASLIVALIKGIAAGAICWFAGFIIADMIFKGIVETGSHGGEDELIDGGILQRVIQTGENAAPEAVRGLYSQKPVMAEKKK
jgi:hypothetical protein